MDLDQSILSKPPQLVPVRISRIIDRLHYPALVEQGIVPDLRPFIKTGTKRYPRWIYQELKTQLGAECFSCFGLFIDTIIRKMISQVISVDWGFYQQSCDPTTNYQQPNLQWKDVCYSTFLHIAKCYKNSINISPEVFNKTFPLLMSMATTFQAAFAKCEQSRVAFNQEFIYQNLAGHPDIVTSNSVIDIKTVTSFKSKAERHFLQILTYTALMRELHRTVDYAGILLSMQKEILMFDLRQWDSKGLVKILTDRAAVIQTLQLGPLHLISEIQRAMIGVGTHIGRKDLTIYECLALYVKQCHGIPTPCQMYLHGRQGSSVKINDGELARIGNLIEMTKFPVFVHGSLCINPSRPWGSKDPTDKSWAIRLLSDQLEASKTMGFKGVVVHTGKPKTMPKEEGLKRMEAGLRMALDSASKESPLMLETPVGAGTELCHRIEDLSAFYSRFSEEEHQVFKICVDTCHVFVAGYDPLDYLQRWEKLQGAASIGLVHFNDSRKKFGCRADGHAPCGMGNIGATKLAQVSAWCRERGISMVTE